MCSGQTSCQLMFPGVLLVNAAIDQDLRVTPQYMGPNFKVFHFVAKL